MLCNIYGIMNMITNAIVTQWRELSLWSSCK